MFQQDIYSFTRMLFLLLLPLLFVSCGSLVEVNGLTSDFDKLNETQKSLVLPFESFDATVAGFVYKVTASELKTELKDYPKAMVRIFNPKCSSNSCQPLSYYQQYADDNDIFLIQVMIGYAGFEEAVQQSSNGPLFVIDDTAYGTKLQPVYERYFTNELLGLPRKTKYDDIPENMIGQLYFFEYGRLTRVQTTL